MGLFSTSRAMEPSGSFRSTLSGGSVRYPEAVGDMFARRLRLAQHAVTVLIGHPLAQPDAMGTPLGDGVGMETLVDHLRPWFARDRSLTRWVALRGSLLFADMAFGDQGQWPAALDAMGMTPDPDQARVQRPELLDSDRVQACEGLVASIAMKLRRYNAIENASASTVNGDPELARVNEAVALDYIAWISVALLRTGRAALLPAIPEPGRLESPGWYPEPIFAKAERYHDGGDWTARCRVVDGRKVEYAEFPMA